MGKNIAKAATTFLFCDGGSCQKAKSEMAVREARAHLRNEGLWDTTHTIRTRCNGRCEDAPTWIVQPGNCWYKNVTPEKAVEIVNAHIHTVEPIEEYLLYKGGNNYITSDNERTPKPIVFKEKTTPNHASILVARAPASDQNIYPLFKKLFENPNGLKLTFPAKDELIILTKHQVDYTDTFDIAVTGSETNFTLAIGPITKAMENDVSQEIKDRKVGVVEVLWDKHNTNYICEINFKNRKGKHLVSFHIPIHNKDAWNYLLSIYLNMDSNKPKIATLLEQ
ncbi:Putative 2Fe-2S ferredoxin involved in cobalamin biosynthesis [Tenacibaculum sp. 190524A02b]|uniref:2Fe-2S ferredoxin involved in cobalamin biosynthesis n=1 Tax=Tenacibaculum vairaonense TaxID=3137860 RepID=A0ABM9PIY1_9FLAO